MTDTVEQFVVVDAIPPHQTIKETAEGEKVTRAVEKEWPARTRGEMVEAAEGAAIIANGYGRAVNRIRVEAPPAAPAYADPPPAEEH